MTLKTVTYELSRFDQAVDVATTLTRSWFRGHSRVIGELTPRIYRSPYGHDIVRHFRPALELQLIEAFKREVPTLPDVPIPSETDRLGWLYVMQHYRTPTRLLDWSKNLLVAMYFVVSSELDEDGELWALYPLSLNKHGHVGHGLPLPETNRVLRYLVDEPYWSGPKEDLANSIGLPAVPDRPVAFEPSRRFPRLVRQAGAFTIHPTPSVGNSITDILGEPTALVRYIVPARVKRRFLSSLAALDIDGFTLFPELEGLSTRIEQEAKLLTYTPPDPPECDGVYTSP